MNEQTVRSQGWRMFGDVFKQIVAGSLPPPNLEPMTDADALYQIATFSWSVTKGSYRSPEGGRSWATYFTSGTQAGQFDGTGFVIYYASEAGNPNKAVGKAAKFAICKHTPIGTGSHAESMRGWHPAHCTSCGLDMSVDSGD